MQIINGILIQAFIYSILALGVLISYKILNFPDLSVEGTFPLGAAVSAIVLTNKLNPFLALPLAFIVGGLAGIVTGLIHIKFKIKDLLSGIIVMSALYSINLSIVGRSNLALFSYKNIFDIEFLDNFFGEYRFLIVVIALAVIIKIILDMFLNTELGYLLRVAGDNPRVISSLGKNKNIMIIMGLGISNGLVALSGAIMAQKMRVFEISIGTGAIVLGLSSVIIGISIFKKTSNIKLLSLGVIIGSLLYQSAIAFAIYIGVNPQNMKLIMSLVFLAVLIISRKEKS